MSCGNLFQILGLRPPPRNLRINNDITPDTIQLQDDVRDLANELLDSSISDEDDHGITVSKFSTIIIPETDMADQIRRVLFTTHKFLFSNTCYFPYYVRNGSRSGQNMILIHSMMKYCLQLGTYIII